MCDASTENCFTCPTDCGICPGCGDGRCLGTEDCASCDRDCGVCSVCGNGVCESDDFETCSNCAEDCGECSTVTCGEVLICSLGCLDFDSSPPQVSLTCIGGCVARACPDVAFLIDRFVNCAIGQFATCGSLECVQMECSAQVEACLRARCP
jgi:hypothetical protein